MGKTSASQFLVPPAHTFTGIQQELLNNPESNLTNKLPFFTPLPFLIPPSSLASTSRFSPNTSTPLVTSKSPYYISMNTHDRIVNSTLSNTNVSNMAVPSSETAERISSHLREDIKSDCQITCTANV